MKINPNSKRHGRAAAVAMWATMERINEGHYGDPVAVQASVAAVGAHLEGYAHASPKAKEGFSAILSDVIAFSVDAGGSCSADHLARSEMRGPALTSAERGAHARAWLKAGAQ